MTKALRIRHGRFGRVAVLEMDRRLVVHAHPHAHLLFKVGGSDTCFAVHERRLPLSTDWAVAVNPWEPHCYPRAPGGVPSLILALHIEPSWLAPRLPGFPGAQCFPCLGVQVSPRLRTLVSTLNAEMIYGEGEDRSFVEEVLVALAQEVREMPLTGTQRKVERSGRLPPVDRRIRRSIEVMHSRIGEHIGFETLARSVGLSRPHFFDLFRRCTALTPSVYWNTLRMERAVAELGAGMRPIHDIGADLGFSAQSNFARFFRDHQGVSPRAYRNAVVTVDESSPPGSRRTPGPPAPFDSSGAF